MCINLCRTNSLIICHIEYGILAYACITVIPRVSKIKTLQKRSVRLVAGKSTVAHADPIFARLNILNAKDLLKLNTCIFMHKYINNILPVSFNDMFTPLSNPYRTLNCKLENHFISIWTHTQKSLYLKLGINSRNYKLKIFISYVKPLREQRKSNP